MNWTNNINRKDLSLLSEEIITDLINNFSDNSIPLFRKNNFTKYDIGLIYRWPLYIITNIFLERLVRAKYSNKLNPEYISDVCNFEYKIDTVQVALDFYNNDHFNKNLLHLFHIIINSNNVNESEIENYLTFDRKTQKTKLILILKNKVKNIRNIFISKKYNDKYFFDESPQLRYFLPKKNKLIEVPYEKIVINHKARKCISDTTKQVFYKLISKLNFHLNENQKKLLSTLFSNCVDYSLPISLIEGLDKRINFYKNILDKNNFKNIHSCIGLYYNDNLKIISSLAKKKDPKINLIWHEHGTNNFINYFPKDSQIPDFNKAITPLYYIDHYLFWGKNKLSNKFDNFEEILNTKIVNVGNVYLQSIKESWRRKRINQDPVLLYSSSPSREYMSNLEEILPEDNMIHQKNIFDFLYILTVKFKHLKIIYKPFNNTNNSELNKYIKDKNFSANNFFISKDKAVMTMKDVDVVLFDTISTGFSESVNIGVPALVYNNAFEYNNASTDGKEINDLLEKNNIVFYNKKNGLDSIEIVLDNPKHFLDKSHDVIRLFKDLMAHPVKKEEFVSKLKENNLI
jgi:hypothetical protein